MAEPRTVIVTHWRIVSDETGGIRYSTSTREDVDAFDRCIAMYERIGHDCHVEQWEETYTVTPSTWRRVWPLQPTAGPACKHPAVLNGVCFWCNREATDG